MGFFSDLLQSSRYGQIRRELEQEALKKQASELALQKARNDLMSFNQATNSDVTGKSAAEENLRKLFGAPIGPLQENQQQAVNTVVAASPNTTNSSFNLPGNLGNLPLETIKGVSPLVAAYLHYMKANANPNEPVMDVNEALKQGSVKKGTRIIQPTNVPVLTEEGALGQGNVPKGARIIPSKVNTAQTTKEQELIQNQIDQLDDMENKLNKIPGGSEGAWQSLAAKSGQAYPDASTYDKKRAASAVSLYRALTGDTRLSDADASNRALPLIPTTYMGEAQRKDLFSSLRTQLQKRLENASGTINDNPPPSSKRIRVKLKSTGQTGTVDSSEFDPNLYERVQ